jgi:hypothetical protein
MITYVDLQDIHLRPRKVVNKTYPIITKEENEGETLNQSKNNDSPTPVIHISYPQIGQP